MDVEQATAEAKRLWGPRARAKECRFDGYVEIVLDIADLIGWDVEKWGPTYQVLGHAKTYEQAIENALKRQFAGSPSAIAGIVGNGEPVQLTMFGPLDKSDNHE